MSLEYKKAVTTLCEDLGLEFPDRFSQDWEYEISDMNRIKEFVDYYKQSVLDEVTKFVLIKIILDSCNDSLGNGMLEEELWKRIELILISEREIHQEIITYWSCEDEDIEDEDCYYITLYIRKIV